MTNARPIIFSGPMVRAILDGRKTQTRRIVKWPGVLRRLQPDWEDVRIDPGGTIWGPGPYLKVRAIDPDFPDYRGMDTWHRVHCPYGYPEEDAHLWVRESFYITPIKSRAFYPAGGEPQGVWPPDGASFDNLKDGVPRPSIHMPRWASRLTLEVTEVRVQRVQDISEADAIAEGMKPRPHEPYDSADDPREQFRFLWDSIHGHGAWDASHWVWAITFRIALASGDAVNVAGDRLERNP